MTVMCRYGSNEISKCFLHHTQQEHRSFPWKVSKYFPLAVYVKQQTTKYSNLPVDISTENTISQIIPCRR